MALLVVSLPLAAGATWWLSKSRDIQLLGRMVKRVDTSVPVVALTFDDGPTPGFSDEILHILHEYGVRATFFVTGAELEAHPELGPRIVAADHPGEIHFRPPYSKRLLAVPAYLNATERATIVFDIEPESYPETAADRDRIVGHVVENVQPGSINPPPSDG